jgi:hypothetical protein
MRLEISNRNILKQVDRALAAQAARAGTSVAELVDASLPAFGLDHDGRLRLATEGAVAELELLPDGRVDVTWLGAEQIPPGLAADVEATTRRIATGVAQERRRLELRLGSERAWSMDGWRQRFGDHPVARILARSLIWEIGTGGASAQALPDGDAWITLDEAQFKPLESHEVRLWHPADASAAQVAAWRATLAARGIAQPVLQAHREVFTPDASGPSPSADTRHAGEIVDHRRLRALLRERTWAVPALGAWDQGDEATAWRDFDSGVRAELRYQAPDRTPTGEPVAMARVVAVRFVRSDGGHPPGSPLAVSVPLSAVPRRVFSEALRDVSLAVGLAVSRA